MSINDIENCDQDLSFGIDQSLRSTGWCITSKDGMIIDYGIIESSPPSEKTVVNTVARCVEISRTLIEKIKSNSIKVVSIEGIAMGGARGSSNRDLAGLQFILISEIMEMGYECVVTPPTRIKKIATGKGNASKDEMVDSLPNDFYDVVMSTPKTRGRYDLTDAYWISRVPYESS